MLSLPGYASSFLLITMFIQPSLREWYLTTNHLMAPKQKLNFKFWLAGLQKGSFQCKGKRIRLYDPVIQKHKSTSWYMKTGRIVLFIFRGKNESCVVVFFFLSFWRLGIFSVRKAGSEGPTLGTLAGLSESNQPGRALNRSLHFSWVDLHRASPGAE